MQVAACLLHLVMHCMVPHLAIAEWRIKPMHSSSSVTTVASPTPLQLRTAGNKYRPDLVDWASVIQAVRVICNYESRICNW
jgi:hypothetical protein